MGLIIDPRSVQEEKERCHDFWSTSKKECVQWARNNTRNSHLPDCYLHGVTTEPLDLYIGSHCLCYRARWPTPYDEEFASNVQKFYSLYRVGINSVVVLPLC